MRAELRRSLLLAMALGTVSTTASADWRKDYDRGLKALDDGRFAEAESAFRAALGEDGQPNARKRFQGVVVKPYVPHHYAGVAAYRQGNCADALEYWRNAASAGVVAGLPELQSVQTRGIADCTQKLAGGTRPPVVTPPVAGPGSTSGAAPGTPGNGGTTPSPSGPRTTPSSPGTAQTPPPARPPVTPPAPAASPAPPALVTLVDAWLGGQYANLTRAEPASLPDARAKAQGFLLRAAARFTLAELGDETQRDAARRDVRAARAANASLSPDETLFSPRFRAFWRETR